MKKILTKKGFTLIELIVVIAILAILAAILIPSITNYITEATEAKDLANARSVYSAATLELATGTALVDGNYLIGSITCTIDVNAAGTELVSSTCGTQTFTP
jgi:prepilin-type N-terminal cleavage/methylation domain-containing protein